MSASSDATAAATALTEYAGAINNLITESLTTSGPPTYGDLQDDAMAKQSAASSALQTFKTSAQNLAAYNVTWRGVTQTAVELADRLGQLINVVPALNDTDAADAATAFSGAATYYAANGQ